MGRHRSDPMGLARLALAVLAAAMVVTLLVIGGRALFAQLDTPERPGLGRQARTATAQPPSAAAQVPTVRIECVADTCPLVTVRVPGGDVLQYRDMSRGEEVSYFEPELDVVLTDAATVRVTANGTPRPQGDPGEREAFTVQGS
ncbi:hypothetical protein AB0C18_11130 [Nonomuraea muscovyensis]|uniref:DUF4115 domain-containing protein n=1 Tax=Nonomuraea muscovyensis TaxID=1124761 RepID=A0A7X0C167_9ACTN|nr:hypothetical protein [Nonomuraea muscovyensis]MBB6346513.1 hypothetical protein [Nonomuraea muscovyensis]